MMAEQAEKRDDVEAETAPDTEEREEGEGERAADAHLADVEEGAGCTEIWEHLSEQRDGD